MRAATLVIAIAACSRAPEPKHFGARFYSDGVHPPATAQCSKGFDRTHAFGSDELYASLEHARAHDLVLHTYAHAPTVNLPEYFDAFDWANAHGVRLVTYRELAGANAYRGAGWAFAIDDDEVDTWYAWRDSLRAHGVHATFFVTNFAKLTPAQLAKLHELAADGHDIEAHSTTHANALDYLRTHDVASYVRDEVVPEKRALTDAGFAPPVAFAYPYGAHTAELDAAVQREFAIVRTTGAENCLKE